MLSGDAARPWKNAARVLLGSVCRKPVKEVWLQRDKNQDDGQRLYLSMRTQTRKEALSSSHLAPQKTKHPSRLAEINEAEQRRQIHILPRSQTVRKGLARLKYSVPIYKARSGFSILTEEYLTFQTVSPSVNLPYIRITSKAASVKLFNILTNKDGGAHYENNFQDKRMEEMLRRWYHWNYKRRIP